MAYNVPGLEGLVMPPAAVAGILTGDVITWDDTLLAEANPDFDLTGLPPITLMSAEQPQGAVEAMTAWTSKFAPESWTEGTVGVLGAGTQLPTVADLTAEVSVTEGAIAILPIFQALNNVLAVANLPVIVTDEDGGTSEVIVTSDDVQLYKVGSGATSITTDEAGNILASPAIGGVPTEGNFDIASSKIVLGEDQALVGELLLNEGVARDGKRVLSADWIKRMQTPCALAPYYGYLVWLNHDRKVFPSVPASSYFGVGAGSSFTWIEPELGMVVIIRWLNSAHADAVFGKIYQAVKSLA